MSRELAGMASHCVGTPQTPRTVSDREKKIYYICRKKYDCKLFCIII